MVAIAAQGALYLALRHLATAYMPAWAHHHVQTGSLPWPSVIPVDVVHGAPGGGAASPEASAPPVPAFIPAPVIVLPAPLLGRAGVRTADQP